MLQVTDTLMDHVHYAFDVTCTSAIESERYIPSAEAEPRFPTLLTSPSF